MEYKMLNLFRKNPRQVLTRGQLLEKLWDIDEKFVDEHTLTTSISRIRSKIETACPTIIQLNSCFTERFLNFILHRLPSIDIPYRKQSWCRAHRRQIMVGQAVSIIVITLTIFIFTKQTSVLLAGILLLLCTFIWFVVYAQILAKRLVSFTSDLCRTIDSMISGNEEPMLLSKLPVPP